MAAVNMTLQPTFAAVAPWCSAVAAAGRPVPAAVDRYLLPTGRPAANPPMALPGLADHDRLSHLSGVTCTW